MKNNKQQSPTKKLFTRGDKQTVGSHHSGSTIETSDQKLITESINNKIQNQKSTKTQLQALSDLRKDIKTIKNEVTKLIQEGFVKPALPPQWFDSSINMSSMSKSSKFSAVNVQQFYGDSKIRKSQTERSGYVYPYDESVYLREECQNLKYLYRLKQQKQAENLSKLKQLLEEVKVLRRCKQQLTKCIVILQTSLKQTNQQVKFHKQENKRIQILLQKCLHEKKQKQNDLGQIIVQKKRLQQQVEYRRAENTQLIRIIEYKEDQVEKLKINYSSQVRAIEIQYRRAYQQANNRPRSDDNYQRQRRAKSLSPFQPNAIEISQIERLQLQISTLKAEVQNRQKIMTMMLNDIKSMDKQLHATDEQHQDLLRCRKLIEDLNQNLMKMEIKRISVKYRYC